MSKISKAVLLAASIVGLSSVVAVGGAQAAMTVIGGDSAQACYEAARDGVARQTSLEDCTQAINFEPLAKVDLAGTFVNRGAIYLGLHDWVSAENDFHQALMLEPKLGEALVNLGAAKIGEHRNKEGIADITEGLALGSMEPEKAYYNRALAYEALGDDKAAYYDYLKASELKPNWSMPREELVRFTVSKPTG